MDISRIRGMLELMEKTGSDDQQYILVKMCELRELADAWERDQQLQQWMNQIVNTLWTAKEATEDEPEDRGGKPEDCQSADENGKKRNADGSEDGTEENCSGDPAEEPGGEKADPEKDC